MVQVKLGQGRPDRCPTANKAVLAVVLAAAANNGVDLLSGCRSLGLRCASIPRRRVSNAIVCDFKKRISSIRRSSLSSTTLSSISIVLLGMFTVISVRMAYGLQQIFV
jgi:hypothetical protein